LEPDRGAARLGEVMNILLEAARRIVSWRIFVLTGLVVLTLCTAGCFDNEPAQRAAFIKFLQTRIIDKPGLHIPIMSADDIKAFGPYASQYRIMNGFHHGLNAAAGGDLAKVMQITAPRSLAELADKRAIFPVLRDGMARMIAELDKDEAKADAAHKALNQPADLKRVYDVAYERMVTQPAKVFREMMPMIDQSLPAVEALAVYLDEHRSAIDFRGNQINVTDPVVRAKLSGLLQDAAKSGEIANEGKRKLRAMAEGR
jgi:hypothetical protein